MRDVVIIGGALALALLYKRGGPEIEAAEGAIKKPLEFFDEGDAAYGKAGEALSSTALVRNATGGSSGAVTSDLAAMSYAERQAYFEGVEGLSSREAMKASLDPGYYERVVGAGYEWSKAGRDAERQASKMEDRHAAASRLGLTYDEYMARNRTGGYAEEAAQKGYSFDPNTSFLGPETKVYSDEDLARPGMERVKAIFDKLMGVEPSHEDLHPEAIPSGSHLGTQVIDWQATLSKGGYQ